MITTGAVNRSFQIGANNESFNWKEFEKVKQSIANLLKCKEIGTIVVVTNGDPKSHLAEIVGENGKLPTETALWKAFPGELKTGKLIIHREEDWGGPNPGSPKALNDGIKILWEKEESRAMCYSTEVGITGPQISKALNFMKEKNLTLVDFLMNGWWQSVQQQIPRNLCTIWEIKPFLKDGGFPLVCGGSDEKTILTERGKVRVAGQEASYKMFEYLRDGCLRWGTVRLTDPPTWTNNFPSSDKVRWKNHLDKLSRQGLVLEEWAGLVFSNSPYETVMDRIFSPDCYLQFQE